MYIWTYVSAYLHIYIYRHTFIYIYIHIYIHIYIYRKKLKKEGSLKEAKMDDKNWELNKHGTSHTGAYLFVYILYSTEYTEFSIHIYVCVYVVDEYTYKYMHIYVNKYPLYICVFIHILDFIFMV
jgi:hypothetical protein